MNAKTLLDELVRQNIITPILSAELTKDIAVSKRPIEDIIHERQLVTDDDLAKIKSTLLKIPYRKVKPEEISPELLKLISEETALSYKVAPISKNNDLLVVGMLNPDDETAQEVLRYIAKREKVNLGVYVMSRSDLDLILRRYNPYTDEVKAALQFVKPAKQTAPERRVVSLETSAAAGDEAPVIKIVASTLREAVMQNASDIHIEPQRSRLRIRFRLDGDLEEVLSLPVELHQAIVSRVKVMSELLIDETRRPQDGRFRTVIMGRDIDFRVATFPTPAGEKVALRVLDPAIGLKGLDRLGLAGRTLDILNKGLNKPFGMILVTGPTGSGKSTTLYSLLQILNKEDVNIVSLEDPVEYYMDGVNQSQVRHDIGYTFASGLRQILRQDPDIIMIGEIRDGETAELAVHAALTGHIVLSTIHTNTATGVIPRLVDMKVDSFLLPAALNLMAGQRLLPQLCNNCKIPEDPAPDVLKAIQDELKLIPEDMKADLKPPYKIYRAQGCAKCKNKGYIGRTALFEVFQMTKQLAEIISHGGVDENKIQEESRRQQMVTLRGDGILKALHGLIPIEEVLRETVET
jgi:type IV pilus assembly protein PilB